jgi:hypothetical protein
VELDIALEEFTRRNKIAGNNGFPGRIPISSTEVRDAGFLRPNSSHESSEEGRALPSSKLGIKDFRCGSAVLQHADA